jgi:hypothetical protein
MDQTKDKKWYLYISDHHEGPFSVADVLDKVALGQITFDHYVWAEGMADWKKIKAVGDFQNIDHSKKTGTLTDLNAVVNRKENQKGVTNTGWTPTKKYPSYSQSESQPESIKSDPSTKWRDLEAGPAQSLEVDMSRVQSIDAKRDRDRNRLPLKLKYDDQAKTKLFRRKLIKRKYLFIILIAVGIYYRGTVLNYIPNESLRPLKEAASNGIRKLALKVSYVFPSVKTWISPVPNLEGVSEELMLALNQAASPNPRLTGGRIEIAMDSNNVDTPIFYVASNMPDGTIIDLYVQGEADTLLNAWQFNSKLTAKINGNWAEFEPLRTTAGQTIPRGYYKIFATESKLQDPEIAKLLMALPVQATQGVGNTSYHVKLFKQARYFLGGKKDISYSQRLKDFQEKLGIKTRSELNEIKGFLETLESQFHSTVISFSQIQKGKVSTKKMKLWADYHTRWTKLTDHLNGTFTKWDLNRFRTEKFHAEFYKMLQDLGRAVADVHEVQSQVFSTIKDRRLYDAQLQQKVDETKALVLQLKMKINQAERTPLKMKLEVGEK